MGQRMNVWKPVELALTYGARAAWPAFQAVNRRFEGPAFQPKWAPGPLKKRRERSFPQFGWPRTTDSLCPTCTREARQAIIDGKQDVSVLLTEKVGEIKATIIERDGKILMVKDCPQHGHFEDVMAMDTAFFKHLKTRTPAATSVPTTTRSSTTTAPARSSTAAARC